MSSTPPTHPAPGQQHHQQQIDDATPPTNTDALSPLEQEVLDEYARLLGNLNGMNQLLADLSENPSAEILDSLRGLERKTSLVFTLLKASVYSIVLQQQIGEDGGGGGSLGGSSVGRVGG
jgi:DASH complex subunit DAD3